MLSTWKTNAGRWVIALTATIGLVPSLFMGCARPDVHVETPEPLAQRTTVDVSSQTPDAEMLRALAPYRAEVAKLDLPIGESAVTMAVKSPQLTLYVADVMLEKAAEISGKRMDAAFMNTGGVRTTLSPGPVSYMTVSEILPFDNTIVIMELRGDQMRALLDHLYEHRNALPVSGIRFVGRGDTMESASIDGTPFDPDRTYWVATNNFLSNGGGGMEMLADVKQADTAVFLRDAFAEHVKEMTARGEKIQLPPDMPRHEITEVPK